MDQLVFASLSQTHYWYEVGMLKVRVDDIITAYYYKLILLCTKNVFVSFLSGVAAWRLIIMYVYKSLPREKLRHAPQKEGG